MDIYFCDLCGIRVTDTDLRTGHGIRSRVDVICAGCLDLGHGKEWLAKRAKGKAGMASPSPTLDAARDRAQTLEADQDAPAKRAPDVVLAATAVAAPPRPVTTAVRPAVAAPAAAPRPAAAKGAAPASQVATEEIDVIKVEAAALVQTKPAKTASGRQNAQPARPVVEIDSLPTPPPVRRTPPAPAAVASKPAASPPAPPGKPPSGPQATAKAGADRKASDTVRAPAAESARKAESGIKAPLATDETAVVKRAAPAAAISDKLAAAATALSALGGDLQSKPARAGAAETDDLEAIKSNDSGAKPALSNPPSEPGAKRGTDRISKSARNPSSSSALRAAKPASGKARAASRPSSGKIRRAPSSGMAPKQVMIFSVISLSVILILGSVLVAPKLFNRKPKPGATMIVDEALKTKVRSANDLAIAALRSKNVNELKAAKAAIDSAQAAMIQFEDDAPKKWNADAVEQFLRDLKTSDVVMLKRNINDELVKQGQR